MHSNSLTRPPPVLVFTPIELRDGLRGEVLTKGQLPRQRFPANLPSIEDWRPWLTQLVADHTLLPGYSTLKTAKNGEIFRACLTGRESGSLDVACRFSRSGERRTPVFQRPSRAARTLHRALRLLQVGIDTAVPFALIERTSRQGPSWLVTEYVAHVVDLDQIVLTLLPRQHRNSLHKLKRGLSETLVELFIRLDEAGLYHRDLKASNILFTHWDGRGGTARPLMVDLDGLHHRRWWSGRRRWQPLIRLTASLKDYPALTRTDFARFLRQFLTRADISAAQWKTHFRRIARQAIHYAKRSQTRKSRKLDGFAGA